MAELLLYSEPVALNRESHRGMKVNPPKDFGFTRQTNSVVIGGYRVCRSLAALPDCVYP